MFLLHMGEGVTESRGLQCWQTTGSFLVWYGERTLEKCLLKTPSVQDSLAKSFARYLEARVLVLSRLSLL